MSPFERFILPVVVLAAAATAQRVIPQSDSSSIDEHGVAHVTRIVPLPRTVSSEAQAFLAQPRSDADENVSVKDNRARAESWQETLSKIGPMPVCIFLTIRLFSAVVK